jgi:hypothetical protein
MAGSITTWLFVLPVKDIGYLTLPTSTTGPGTGLDSEFVGIEHDVVLQTYDGNQRDFGRFPSRPFVLSYST